MEKIEEQIVALEQKISSLEILHIVSTVGVNRMQRFLQGLHFSSL
jgi:hypothetical protein